ncbi:MAG: hypothetical protein PHC61_03100 [Chitinivibrionales bacterium]|nr:hypothetical protein [Chitinivibrionales bacterium]
MRITRCLVLAAAMGLQSACTLLASDWDWPSLLVAPEGAATDSPSVLMIHSEQTKYLSQSKSNDSFVWRHNDSLSALSQMAAYQITYDPALGSTRQYADLSGSFFKKIKNGGGAQLGLEWAPTLVFSQNDSIGGQLTTLEAGPSGKFALLNIPVTARSGIAARTLNNQIPSHVFQTHLADYFSDVGYYGGLQVAGNRLPFSLFPLYGGASLYGRRLGGVTTASALGGLMGMASLYKEDSIFAGIADSFSSGSQISPDGKSHFVAAPQTIGQTLTADAVLRPATRLHCAPLVFYEYSQQSQRYRDQQFSFSDVQNYNHAIAASLTTDSLIPVEYRGRIRFDNGGYDRLFTRTFKQGSILQQPQTAVESSLVQQYTAQLDDYNLFKVNLEQHLASFTKTGTGIAYDYTITRTSKTYPHFYLQYVSADSNALKRNDNDNDRIYERHQILLVPLAFPRFKFELSGSLTKNTTSYVRGENSGQNSIDRMYRLGAALSVAPSPRVFISEKTNADTKVTSYNFPQFHIGKYPPYSRTFSSAFAFRYEFSPQWSCKGEWNETYWDEGVWKTRVYLDTTGLNADSLAAAFYNEYQIDRKNLTTDVSLSVQCKPSARMAFQVGSSFGDNYYREFSAGRYVVNSLGKGYTIIPFFIAQLQWGNYCSFVPKIRRIIDTIADDYWDLSIVLDMQW